MKTKFTDYIKLVEKVDAFSDKVLREYADEIVCNKGCSSCCAKVLSFFPVELLYIVDYIKNNDVDIQLISDNIKAIEENKLHSCPFLDNDECIIYDVRPIICRTFGLPAMVEVDDDNKAELLICEQNFANKQLKIEKEFLFNLNTLNSMLFIINSVFVKTYEEVDENIVRISVMDALNYL